MASGDNLNAELDDLAEALLTENRRARFRQVVGQRLNCLTAVFECISDPQNVSACVRTAELFGLSEIYLLGGRSSEPNHQISMAAERWLKVHRYTNLKNLVHALRTQDYTIVGTLPHDDAKPFDEFMLPAKLALVFGTERYGLTEEFQSECDAFTHIPMYGFTQSLNLSAAAAILLQHFQSAYRRRGGAIHLSGNEQETLIHRWTERDVRVKLRLNRRSARASAPSG